MRLLNTMTGRFHGFEDPRKVSYAALSHVWSRDLKQEKTYQDVLSLVSGPKDPDPINHPSFPKKIRFFCEAAKAHGFDFGWADSCCIDKTSSSELSETINSMYYWYHCAGICLVYLHDIDVEPDAPTAKRNQALCDSEWFQCGWTLQELLAPSILLFLSKTWKAIASKQTSAAYIALVTNIDQDILTFERSLDEVSVACKMSWAASRRTTREEDEAYCLMGLFGVNIPIVYGEGCYAFIRLQEEIIKTVPDQSIFAWGRILEPHRGKGSYRFGLPFDPGLASESTSPNLLRKVSSPSYLMVSSPTDFANSSHITPLSRDEFAQKLGMPLEPYTDQVPFTATAYGILAHMPLITVIPHDHDWQNFPALLALLACQKQDDGSLLALFVDRQIGSRSSGFAVGAVVGNRDSTHMGFPNLSDLQDWRYHATYLSLQDIRESQQFIRMTRLYISHRPLRGTNRVHDPRSQLFHSLYDSRDNFQVCLSRWSRTFLSGDGYRLHINGGDELTMRPSHGPPRLHLQRPPWLVFASKYVHIKIQFGHCKCRPYSPARALLGALVWTDSESPPDASESSPRQRFMEEHHYLDHPAHFYSWAVRGGVASTTIMLQLVQGVITIRLALCPARLHPLADLSSTNVYELGIEATSHIVDIVHPVLTPIA